MTDHDMMKRLEALERENRRMKRIGAAALTFLGAGVLMGQAAPKKPPPKTIEAQAFVLVDDKGVERGIFGTSMKSTMLLFGGQMGGGGEVKMVADKDGTSVAAFRSPESSATITVVEAEATVSVDQRNGRKNSATLLSMPRAANIRAESNRFSAQVIAGLDQSSLVLGGQHTEHSALVMYTDREVLYREPDGSAKRLSSVPATAVGSTARPEPGP